MINFVFVFLKKHAKLPALWDRGVKFEKGGKGFMRRFVFYKIEILIFVAMLRQ